MERARVAAFTELNSFVKRSGFTLVEVCVGGGCAA